MPDEFIAMLTDVLITGMVGFGFGAVWYGKFGDRWMRAVGRTKEELAADKSSLPFVIAGVCSLLAATIMRLVFWKLGMSGLPQGLALGAGIGFLLIAPWVVLNYAFAARPRDLWWIDGLHAALAFSLMGVAMGFLV